MGPPASTSAFSKSAKQLAAKKVLARQLVATEMLEVCGVEVKGRRLSSFAADTIGDWPPQFVSLYNAAVEERMSWSLKKLRQEVHKQLPK